MSWSLGLSNGDLSFGSSGLNVVTDAAKLVQDLSCAILERMGTDDMHMGYGSLIDGGTDTLGHVHDSVIGTRNDAAAASFVKSEIQRVGQGYQIQQITRNQDDLATYGRSTLTVGESLVAMDHINTEAITDHLLVTVGLETGVASITLAVPLGS